MSLAFTESPLYYKDTQGNYHRLLNTGGYSVVTQSADGLMSSNDKTKLDNIIPSNYLLVNQGSSYTGSFLVVGSDGNIIPVTMSAWQGGNY